MKLLSILPFFFIFFLLFSFNANAINLNENYNFSTISEAHDGLTFFEQIANISCFPNAYNNYYPSFIPSLNDSNNITANGVAWANYSDCYPNEYNSIYFYPLDNSKSTIFHISSGFAKASVRFYFNPSGSYVYSNPVDLQIRNANTGIIYNQSNLTISDFANYWNETDVSYNFTNDTDVQFLLKFDDFYNYFGINFNIQFYFDYFKVEGLACVPSVYCINEFDYKVVSANCSETIFTYSPKLCKNFLDYSLGNTTSVKGIGKYDNETEQTTDCYDENYNKINCNSLEAGTNNPFDSIALFTMGFLGIKDLATSRFAFSLIVSLIISFVALYYGKENTNAHLIFGIAFLGSIIFFTAIGFFPSWLFIIMLILVAYLVATTIQKGL
jgi:hypothetical protein